MDGEWGKIEREREREYSPLHYGEEVNYGHAWAALVSLFVWICCQGSQVAFVPICHLNTVTQTESRGRRPGTTSYFLWRKKTFEKRAAANPRDQEYEDHPWWLQLCQPQSAHRCLSAIADEATGASGSNRRGCHGCRLTISYITWTLDRSRAEVLSTLLSSAWSPAESPKFECWLTQVITPTLKLTSWPG